VPLVFIFLFVFWFVKFLHRLLGCHFTLPMFPFLSQRMLLHGKCCTLSGAIDWANAHNLYSRTNNTQQSGNSIGAAFNFEHCMRICNVAHARPLYTHHISKFLNKTHIHMNNIALQARRFTRQALFAIQLVTRPRRSVHEHTHHDKRGHHNIPGDAAAGGKKLAAACGSSEA